MVLSRTRRVCASAIAILGFVVSLGVAQGATSNDVLPDLVSDPVERPQLQTYTQPDGDHLLLRFDGYLHNAGPGALELRGSNPSGTEMQTVIQRIYAEDHTYNTTDTDPTRSPVFKWEPADGHSHWHLKNASRYSLWNEARTAEVGVSQKVGFCLADTEPVERMDTEYAYSIDDIKNCEQPDPPYNGAGASASDVMAGISPGWRDKYTRSLAFQYIDVTDVQPGRYWIRSQADPTDVVREVHERNDAAFNRSLVTVPGYQALAIARGGVAPTGPSSITLDAKSFTPHATEEVEKAFRTNGPRQFKIVEAPKHGALSRATGTPFTPATLTYTPNWGWVGPDSFKYVAFDSESRYPLHPAPATVSLSVGPQLPSVAVAGAPSTIVAGTSAQIWAIVIADQPGVVWSVDGVVGGSAPTGTISPHGLYIAPKTVPVAGSVKIRATSASGAYDEETVKIVAPPVQLPAPLPTVPVTPTGGGTHKTAKTVKRTLTSLKLGRSGRWLLVGVKSSETGVVRTYATKGKRRIGYCRTKATANRPLTCKILVPRRIDINKVRVLLTLRVDGKLVESLTSNLASANKRVTTSAGHHH